MSKNQTQTQKAFHERFRALLDEKSGGRQSKFAESMPDSCKVSRQLINAYYNGDKYPDINTLAKLSSALGVSSDYLLGLSDYRTSDINIKAAAELTGLSEDAIEALIFYKNKEEENLDLYRSRNPTAEMINTILEAVLTSSKKIKDRKAVSRGDLKTLEMQTNPLLYQLEYIRACNGISEYKTGGFDDVKDAIVKLNGFLSDVDILEVYKTGLSNHVIEMLEWLSLRYNCKE